MRSQNKCRRLVTAFLENNLLKYGGCIPDRNMNLDSMDSRQGVAGNCNRQRSCLFNNQQKVSVAVPIFEKCGNANEARNKARKEE
jgi:hypothetical protein